MSAAIVIALFAHYATVMAVFGASAFRLLMPRASDANVIDGRLRPLLVAGAFFAVVSAVVLTMLEAASMTGDWRAAANFETIGAVLTETSFGRVWCWRLGLTVVVAVSASITRPRAPWIALSAAALLATLALVGHAAMVEGFAGDLRRLAQAVHLLAGGAWIGGAIPLALVLAAARHDPKSAIPVLLRFSFYGAVAVLLILASGMVNAIALVGTWSALTGTDFGVTLLAKLALVGILIAVALINRLALVPMLDREPERALQRLCRSVALEIALGALVVLVASRLGTLLPPGA